MIATLLLLSVAQASIPVDTAWKTRVHALAKGFTHPSWGFTHSERNYLNTLQLAEADGAVIDTDVLFAASFLHDMGGLEPYAKQGVDHAVRSVELAEPMLRDWGFPMEKFPRVREMILGHTYYGAAPASREALAFRDADVLDFLGALGAARLLAATTDDGMPGAIGPVLGVLTRFASDMPAKLTLPESRRRGAPLAEETRAFVKSALAGVPAGASP